MFIARRGCLRLLLFLLALLVVVAPPPGQRLSLETGTTYHEDYLKQYGYLDSRFAHLGFEDAVLKTAVRKFQQMAHLPITGEVDAATDGMMKVQRCSFPDASNNDRQESPRKSKRYAVYEKYWSKKELTFSILNYPLQNLTQQELRSEIQHALQLWSNASSLRFTDLGAKINGEAPGADITLAFYQRNHGDGYPFDGRGRTLAHTFIPPMGRIHLDIDEEWTSKTIEGINFLHVVTHELGHALGLKHSSDSDSIMKFYYTARYKPNLQLADDDTRAIQALYGLPRQTKSSHIVGTDRETANRKTIKSTKTASAASTKTRTPAAAAAPATPTTSSRSAPTPLIPTTNTQIQPTDTRPTDRASVKSEKEEQRTALSKLQSVTIRTKEDWCFDGRIDALLVIDSHISYAFRGDRYAQITERGIDPDSLLSIRDDWRGISGDIDAAFHWPADETYPDSATYLLKADLCWKYNASHHLKSGYPRLIREEFPGVPDEVDSVLVINAKNFNYFIKGTTFYRYSRLERKVYPGLPLSLFTWKGLPERVDAAVRWINARTFFFREKQVYLVNGNWVEPGFPKSTSTTWLGCPETKDKNTDIQTQI